MKRNYYLNIALMAFMIVCQNQVCAQFSKYNDNTSSPGETFSDVLDFGRMRAGQKLEGAFLFVNETNEDMVIADIKPTCGCTVIEDEEKQSVYAPGDTIRIPFTLKTYATTGPTRKTIKVVISKPVKEEKNLVIKANLFQDVQLSKKYISFKDFDVSKSQLEKKKIHILNNSDKAIKLSGTRSNQDFITIHPTGDTIKSNDSLAVEIHLHPHEKMIRHGRVFFMTDNHVDPPLNLVLKIYIIAPRN